MEKGLIVKLQAACEVAYRNGRNPLPLIRKRIPSLRGIVFQYDTTNQDGTGLLTNWQPAIGPVCLLNTDTGAVTICSKEV